MRLPSRCKNGEGSIHGEETVQAATKTAGVRETTRYQQTREVNWGTSGVQERAGIIHKPARNSRGSDVAIVSDDLPGLNNRMGSQGPLDQWCGSRGIVPPSLRADYGSNAAPGDTHGGSL